RPFIAPAGRVFTGDPRLVSSRRHMPGLRLDSGRLFKGAKKPVAGRR
ncbi:hypothetical protein HCW99_03535, partial [Escherichia coli]|nr:hypothetical protein [Escherichia coli]